jgi:hypothetical protein
MDMDSVQMILPALNEQRKLCLRRTIVQQTSQRTATIYSQQVDGGQPNGNNGWGGFGNWGSW